MVNRSFCDFLHNANVHFRLRNSDPGFNIPFEDIIVGINAVAEINVAVFVDKGMVALL